MEVLYLIGGFVVSAGLFAFINWLHSRWAWRQAAREVNAILGQRPPRPLPPAPVPPICAETGVPKDPRNCWNVRCQLGGTCCRAAAAKDVDPQFAAAHYQDGRDLYADGVGEARHPTFSPETPTGGK